MFLKIRGEGLSLRALCAVENMKLNENEMWKMETSNALNDNNYRKQ